MNEALASIEMDQSGLVRACPQCGRKNRMAYNRLDQKFRCSNCHSELPPPSEPIHVDGEAAFDTLIREAPLPLLVDFWAPWCSPCRMVAPELEKIAANGTGRWIVAKLNTEDFPQLATGFGISAIPTMVLFRGGTEIARQSGAMPAPRIEQFIEQGLRASA